MKEFDMGNGNKAFVNDDAIPILEGRKKFVEEFCKQHGWNAGNLTIEQVLEIRKQDGWKNVQ